MRYILLFILLPLFVTCSSNLKQSPNCYYYEKTQMKGVLEERPFPDNDSSYWILVTKPFCTVISPNEEISEAYQSQTEIHLSLTDFNKYRHLINKAVIVYGTLYSRHTRHHMRNILISVDKIIGVK